MQSFNDQANPPPNPFQFSEPTIVSFSGGRTSGLMLWSILQAHGGRLPNHVKVCFANTGKERNETLDFVQDCSAQWSTEIIWLEFDSVADSKYHIVSHNSADRDGRPFREVITQRSFLPNPVSRFCTTEMKIRTIKHFAMRELGWEHWINAIGLRYDEPHRVAKINNHKERWETVAPLHTARITKREVTTFWKTQPFDLRLQNINGVTPEGNCDLCFLKKFPTMMGLIRAEPWRADWWALMEKTVAGTTSSFDTARFRKDRPSYTEMKQAALDQMDMLANDDDLTECYCHD